MRKRRLDGGKKKLQDICLVRHKIHVPLRECSKIIISRFLPYTNNTLVLMFKAVQKLISAFWDCWQMKSNF